MQSVFHKANVTRTWVVLSLLFSLLVLFTGALAARPAVVRAQGAQPNLILTKEIEGGVTSYRVGDVIRYRIRWQCSSLVGPCGQMTIDDVLPAELVYLPPPDSSVPAGFTISYNAGTRTVTITKNDNNLLDGSQYDAIIAVRVPYTLRPLPYYYTNGITGSIDPVGFPVINATPAFAPQITVTGVEPAWVVTKTLVSPAINPTVDTDVTYQVRLCPGTPTGGLGVASLYNVVLYDDLPVNGSGVRAAFVSASNGGTYDSGTGRVTWPVIPGPIDPPSCVSRSVTIRYPSADFSVNDQVTNTGIADGEYRDSNNILVGPQEIDRGSITHAIDPISEVPSYSKSDTGDPIGYTDGLGRFILNLNTNGTNYPSNDLTLIDNLPPQLQVTQVTSGAWAAGFNYVRAYVEYSTDNGANWTAFPGQPVAYNANAVYAAPVTTITNVRWRFETDSDGDGTYTPGLPYTWSFTTSPEIRVIARRTAVVGPPPLPAAVAGSTYTNCLQVSRRPYDPVTGLPAENPVLDPCDNEPMTVQGELVSLRVSKAETPGGGYDNLFDPQIDTFVPDASILPGDTLRYTLTVEVTERSSTDLVTPVIRDTIPAGLIFVRNGTARLDGTPLGTQPVFDFTSPNLTWRFPALTVTKPAFGSRFLTVEFFARIPPGQAPNTYTNDLRVVTNSTSLVCEIGQQGVTDGSDLDGDGNTTETVCVNPDTYVVERSAALRGEKWVRAIDPGNGALINASTFLPDASCPDGGNTGIGGTGGNTFTRFPCVAQALPEGSFASGVFAPPSSSATVDDFEYNLRIFNDGNVPMVEYVLYDILPYVGDTGSGGTLASTARLSEFRPILRGPVEFLSGPGTLTGNDFTIEYNATSNPCRPEVFDAPAGQLIPAGCDDNWSTNWSGARSYRIRLNTGAVILQTASNPELRFGVPMYIPAIPSSVIVPNDPQPLEIAWNSYAHVGSYSVGAETRDLLSSEPRKVGITVPERMSVGNRVWRDADNSGTINPADDTAPGIPGVTVNLYRDTNGDGAPDGAAIATVQTDSGGYYLFSNIPYDAVTPGNNRYLIGIPASNFNAGQPLYQLRSSTGTPASAAYTNPPENNGDSNDNGIDPAVLGQEVFSATITLLPNSEPTAEADLSANDRDGVAGARRGVSGEPDNNSDLTIDFGFFGGSDVPFSIGNHVWRDNGSGGGVLNDGIRNGTEPPVAGLDVELYRDGNLDGNLTLAERIRTDITDTNGFYLFDNLDPGSYYVRIPASEFAGGQPLYGWFSSQTTGTETTGVPGNPNVPNTDSDDNGVDTIRPWIDGVTSGVVVLARGVNEPTGETHLSNEADPGFPANAGYNPTGWDGPESRGRFGEPDENSNLTIDFGFIPPMSLGNRVWIDDGAGTSPFRTGYNNGLMDGSEVGRASVQVDLYRDTNGTPGLQTAGDTLIDTVTTDALGYYLFERVQPASDYYIHIASWNFSAAGRPLYTYISSYDPRQATPPADDAEDKDDNGIDNANPSANGIASSRITMAYGSEPLSPAQETDLPAGYGPNHWGTLGQLDVDSNLTFDFGFVLPPRSVGNYLWLDVNNNGQFNLGELPVPPNVRVSLYLDLNADNVPDDQGVIGDSSDDWVGYDLTDANGFYLFDNLPPQNYIIGVDRANFAAGGPLEGFTSSTGHVDNATNNLDSRDNGVDRLTTHPLYLSYGIISTRINLAAAAPNGEAPSGNTAVTLGFNPTAGDGPQSRGRYGETDTNSDLTMDFGFFRPMSIGNRVWLDDGAGGGVRNDGVMNGTEAGIAGVRVELYRDINANNRLDLGVDTLVNYDITNAGGYYLFDRLLPGDYFVHLPASNFGGAGPLAALTSSTDPLAGARGDDGADRDDNGVDENFQALNGVTSRRYTLAYVSEPAGETDLSNEADPGSPANTAFNPTGWDGPTSYGRWNETDTNSDVTADFGFAPPTYSIGNRVWFDRDNSGTINPADGANPGLSGVNVLLYLDNGDNVYTGADTLVALDVTDTNGYYLFETFNQQPGDLPLTVGSYWVVIDEQEFRDPAGNPSGGTLFNFYSSNPLPANRPDNGLPPNDTVESNDNGVYASGDPARPSNANPASGGMVASTNGVPAVAVVISLGGEPVDSASTGNPPLAPNTETDYSGAAADNRPGATLPGPSRGTLGQLDSNSNLTIDFGFYQPMSLGNRVWFDRNNDGAIDAGDGTAPGLAGVLVELYRDSDNSGSLNAGDALVASDTTDANGYYLFDNLIEGNYFVVVADDNFLPSGVLVGLDSSTYTAGDNGADSDDNGVNTPVAGFGVASQRINLTLGAETQAESDLSNNPADGTAFIGTNGEVNPNSDVSVDFGFYSNTLSVGNHVWFDTGAGGGIFNNGYREAGEPAAANVRVELWRETNGTPGLQTTGDTLVGFDLTDANGYYLFDRVAAGDYYLFLPPVNFQAGGPLRGHNSSFPTGSENTGANGGTALADIDRDDNGVNDVTPEVNGIASGLISLVVDNEPVGESDRSNEPDPGAPANAAFNPTGWDGPNSQGRWNDTDNNSNLTVDFGLIPVFSLGNRVWFDTDNNSILDASEAGAPGVSVQLYAEDASGQSLGQVPVGPDGVLGTADDALGGMLTDANGYYLFNNLPAGYYRVVLPASNFAGVLAGSWSSGTLRDASGAVVEAPAALADGDIDLDDNGTLQSAGPFAGAVTSSVVVLGPGTASEPPGESDLAAGGQGQPDLQANMTVDFGFYTIRLGDLVWRDVDNSGRLDGAEIGISGVDVELWSSDGTGPLVLLATDTTDAGGIYTFTGLVQGDYILRIPAREFEGTGTLRDYRSSTGNGTEPAPDADLDFTDSDDNGEETNGILGLGGYIQAKPVTLTPAAEQSADPALGLTTEFRVDFGLFSGPQIDLAVTKDDGVEFYVAGGTLNYAIVVTNNGPADVNDIQVSDVLPPQITGWTWSCAEGTPAEYACDGGSAAPFTDLINLPYGASLTYNVFAQVSPSATGVLDNTVTVTPPEGYSETDGNNNTDTDSDQDAAVEITKDDGVTVAAPGATLTYRVNVRNTGGYPLVDLVITDTLPAGLTYQAAFQGATPVPPTTISGSVLTWDKTSIPGLGSLAVGGSLSFDLVVKVDPAPPAPSLTNTISIVDTPTGTSSSDEDTDNIATTNVKTLTATSEPASGSTTPANPEPVFIGEILTYTIRLDVPVGTLGNLKALDVLDAGLAFVRCVSVDAGTLSTDLPGGFAAACANTNPSTNPLVSAEPPGSSDPLNQGRRVLFNFGNVTNADQEIGKQPLLVTYEVIVLDVTSNANGVDNLNNRITWSWDPNSTLSGEAVPVKILEPALSITKSTLTTTAVTGSKILFTLQVAHTPESTAPAFDVVVSDVFPLSLELDPASVVPSGHMPTAFDYSAATRTLRLDWDVFPLGQTATIAFEAVFRGPSPAVNTAGVEWTSLPLDQGNPPVPRSIHNSTSIERWFNPVRQNPDGYRNTSSVAINEPERLPDTGFAPGEVTALPAQPAAKAYTGLGDMVLEIPRLGISIPVAGVPIVDGQWDLTWLSNQAGYLSGTTFPGLVGTTGLTGHVTLADGTPGPFRKLDRLAWGDRIVLRINGLRYIYEVRQNLLVSPSDLSVLRNDGYTWLTLLTCQDYAPARHSYTSRVAVRAVLLRIEP